MKKSLVTLIILLIALSGCYNYYIASRTPDRTMSNSNEFMKGDYLFSDQVDSGQWHIFWQEWKEPVCQNNEDCPTGKVAGSRTSTVGKYFTDCPGFVLTCGM